eukprot:COSAG01_NODE_9271_length_2496_cov_5.806842_4_plen_155_part_00
MQQHAQGVLNYLLLGEKQWRLESHCSPGFVREVTQVAGDLVWLPPGWYHSVKTTNTVEDERLSITCLDGVTRNFSVSMPMFHTPGPLRRLAVSEWGSGLVNEAQSAFSNGWDKRLANPNWHFGRGKKAKTEGPPVPIPEEKLRAAIRATLAPVV